MIGRDRKRARLVSEYTDAFIARLRGSSDRSAAPEEEGQLDELIDLARELGAIETPPSPQLRRRLSEELRRESASVRASALEAGSPRTGLLSLLLEAGGGLAKLPKLRSFRFATATAAGLLVLLVTFFNVSSNRTASAAELLMRSDLALQSLAGPGELLYQRHLFRTTLRQPDGSERTTEQIVHEWADGSDLDHAAARGYAPDGTLRWAYLNTRDGELGHRPSVYFTEHHEEGARSLLTVRPTRKELEQQLDSFHGQERRLLKQFLDRAYIYQPVMGHIRHNSGLLATHREQSGAMPRILLSLDEVGTDGMEGRFHRVRIVEPARLYLVWGNGGPRTDVVRVETLRHIHPQSLLTVKSESVFDFRDGRQMRVVAQVLETRIERFVSDGSSPFELLVPPGTPVRVHSALEELKSLAGALESLPVPGT
jgi:hypothetical protein